MTVQLEPKTTRVVKNSNRGASPGERRGGREPGVPNKSTREIQEIARKYSGKAIEKAARMAGLILDQMGEVEGIASSEQAQLTALQMILDRAHGKPAQAVTGADGGPIVLNVTRIELVAPDGHSQG